MYSDGGDFDEAHEVGEELVVSGGDAAEVFELVEEALDPVALLVDFLVVVMLVSPVALGRDDRDRADLQDGVVEGIRVIALFCQDPGIVLDFVYRKDFEVGGRDMGFALELRNLLNTDFDEYQELGNKILINNYELGASASVSLPARL